MVTSSYAVGTAQEATARPNSNVHVEVGKIIGGVGRTISAMSSTVKMQSYAFLLKWRLSFVLKMVQNMVSYSES